MEDGAIGSATAQACRVPAKNEAPGTVASPTASCSAPHILNLEIKDSIIAPGAMFIGTSLSQGHSHNSGRG